MTHPRKKTIDLVDPSLLGGLELMPSFEISSMEDIRNLRALLVPPAYSPEALRAERLDYWETEVASDKGGTPVRVLVFRPKNKSSKTPALLWAHGGGYILGNPELSTPSLAEIADRVSCCVVSVDYRIAPETPWPGPLEDCYSALKWMADSSELLNIDTNRIAIGGDSAGGGLAAALAMYSRDQSGPPICFQLLNAPMIDDRTAASTKLNAFTGEFVWTHETNKFCWRAYLGAEPGSGDISSYAAPGRAEDLSNLPPAYISVGALDLFLEENIEYARNLLRSGVPTELHVIPGAYHGFEISGEAEPVRAVQRRRMDALAQAFASN